MFDGGVSDCNDMPIALEKYVIIIIIILNCFLMLLETS